MSRLPVGLQQRVKAARESSVETRQRALALLASIIQKHVAGTPAGRPPLCNAFLFRSMGSLADEAALSHLASSAQWWPYVDCLPGACYLALPEACSTAQETGTDG